MNARTSRPGTPASPPASRNSFPGRPEAPVGGRTTSRPLPLPIVLISLLLALPVSAPQALALTVPGAPPPDAPPRPVCYVTPPTGLSATMPATVMTAPAAPGLHPFAPKTLSKVDSGLRDLVEQIRTAAAQSGAAALDGRAFSNDRFRVTRSLSIQVYVRCNQWSDATRAALEAEGLSIEIIAPTPYTIVQGWIPYDAIGRLEALGFVQSVGPPAYPVVHMGSKMTEGDAIMKTADVRNTLGVNGSGTRVGIISDSADQRAAAQATGDLPADSSIYVGKAGDAADEGTAMMEIVYDMAPGALLGFYGPDTSLDMANGITDLKNHGCNVISDDISFIDQPCFEEGPIEQAINSVTAGGAVYVTCATNWAQDHYGAPYNNVTANVMGATGVNVHSYGNLVEGLSAYLMPIGCPANTNTRVVLQWDSPWGHAADDYDIYLTDAGATGYYAKSENTQEGSQDPIEMLSYNIGATDGWRFLLITRYKGEARKLKVYVLSGVIDNRYRTIAGSIGFNNKAQNALVVGAIDQANPGNTTIEDFSSQGPVAISYPAAATWNKPDITGIDGVQVTGAGGFASPFFGTSAASPSVAAVAALVRSAVPSLTPAQVKAAITGTATERGAAGYDTIYGWGLANALAAVQSVKPSNHLAFGTQPAGATAGLAFATQPIVRVLDANNAVVPSYTGAVTLTIKGGTGTNGAQLLGTKMVNAVAGVATFTNLSIDQAGTGYVLTASTADAGSVDSQAFNVAAVVTATKLAFTTQPGGAPSNQPLNPQPVVAAQNASGATVTSYTGPITVAIKANTGTKGAALSGTKTVNAVNGVATFSGLSINLVGTGYVLTATSGTLAAADSAAFAITGVYPPGDLNKDGVFNMADIAFGARVLGGLAVFP